MKNIDIFIEDEDICVCEKRILDIKKYKKIESFKEFKEISIKNEAINIIISGKDIFVLSITIPKLTYSEIKELIKNELELKFSSLDNILFDFTIFKESKENYSILIYCLYFDLYNVINKLKCKKEKIKSVLPIQLYSIYKISKEIKEKNFIAIVKYKEECYVNGYYNYKLIGSAMLREVINLSENNSISSSNEIKLFIDRLKSSIEKDFNYSTLFIIEITNDDYNAKLESRQIV